MWNIRFFTQFLDSYFLTHLLDSSQAYTHYQINEVMLTIVYKNVVGHMSLLLLDVDWINHLLVKTIVYAKRREKITLCLNLLNSRDNYFPHKITKTTNHLVLFTSIYWI
jgi:hypothetical protein